MVKLNAWQAAKADLSEMARLKAEVERLEQLNRDLKAEVARLWALLASATSTGTAKTAQRAEVR